MKTVIAKELKKQTEEKTTPRNKIFAPNVSKETYVEIDTLFEICDAEFNSDKVIHSLFEKTSREYKEFTKTFARLLKPYVDKVADREKLCMYGSHPRYLVAMELSKIWILNK